MGERLLRRDVEHVLPPHTTKRTAARGDDQSLHLVGRAATQTLSEGRVLTVDGDDLTRLGGRLHQRPPNDERLLVGQRQRRPGVQRREGRGQTDRAGDAVEDHIGRAAGQLGRRVVTG